MAASTWRQQNRTMCWCCMASVELVQWDVYIQRGGGFDWGDGGFCLTSLAAAIGFNIKGPSWLCCIGTQHRRSRQSKLRQIKDDALASLIGKYDTDGNMQMSVIVTSMRTGCWGERLAAVIDVGRKWDGIGQDITPYTCSTPLRPPWDPQVSKFSMGEWKPGSLGLGGTPQRMESNDGHAFSPRYFRWCLLFLL